MAESKKKKQNKKGEVLRSQIPEGNKRNRKQISRSCMHVFKVSLLLLYQL